MEQLEEPGTWAGPTGTSSIWNPRPQSPVSPPGSKSVPRPLCPVKQGQAQRAPVVSGTEPASRPPGISCSRLFPTGSPSEGCPCVVPGWADWTRPPGDPRHVFTSLLHSAPTPPVLLASATFSLWARPRGPSPGSVSWTMPPQGCSLTFPL